VLSFKEKQQHEFGFSAYKLPSSTKNLL